MLECVLRRINWKMRPNIKDNVLGPCIANVSIYSHLIFVCVSLPSSLVYL